MIRRLALFIALVASGFTGCHAEDESRVNDKSVTHGIGMKLTLIPAGEFQMGSPASELGHNDKHEADESPQHRVRITQAFYLGTYEVTQEQWQTVMGTTPWRGRLNVEEGPDFPATYINWNEAKEFCRKLSAREGKIYDLPTEAQWEYACRAGTATPYSFGDDGNRLSDHAWWGGIVGDGNAKNEPFAHPVGRKQANPWGLYDMHGNVWEWCEDCFDEDYYQRSGTENPVNRVDSFNHHAIRSGGWQNFAAACRSASRAMDGAAVGRSDLGFRVALLSPR